MIGVTAILTIQDGQQEAFETAFRGLMAGVKANEPDCATYQLYKSRTNPTEYTVLEEYTSQEALDAHGQSEHFKAAMPAIGACLAGTPVITVLDSVD